MDYEKWRIRLLIICLIILSTLFVTYYKITTNSLSFDIKAITTSIKESLSNFNKTNSSEDKIKYNYDNFKTYEENNKISEEISINEIAKEDLSSDEFEYFLSENTQYRLKISSAALGARSYTLYKTDDSGKNWTILNEDPFNTLGVATGIFFIDENIGFLTLANKGLSSSEIYKTIDGGKTYSELELPERNMVFDFPIIPFVEKGILTLIVEQGSDGDFNGGSKLKYQSSDNGNEWILIE